MPFSKDHKRSYYSGLEGHDDEEIVIQTRGAAASQVGGSFQQPPVSLPPDTVAHSNNNWMMMSQQPCSVMAEDDADTNCSSGNSQNKEQNVIWEQQQPRLENSGEDSDDDDDDGRPVENEFASLEAMLNSQEEEEQEADTADEDEGGVVEHAASASPEQTSSDAPSPPRDQRITKHGVSSSAASQQEINVGVDFEGETPDSRSLSSQVVGDAAETMSMAHRDDTCQQEETSLNYSPPATHTSRGRKTKTTALKGASFHSCGSGGGTEEDNNNITNGSSLLEASRRFAKKQAKARKMTTKTSKGGPVAVSNPKSIVGSRPTHWRTLEPLAHSNRLRRTVDAKRRRPDLAAALSRPLGLLRPSSSSSLPSNNNKRPRGPNSSSSSPPSAPVTTATTTTAATTTAGDGNNEPTKKQPKDHDEPTAQEKNQQSTTVVSFAPSFVAKSVLQSPTARPRDEETYELDEDNVDDDDNEPMGGGDKHGGAFSSPWLTSPQRHRQSMPGGSISPVVRGGRRNNKTAAAVGTAGPLFKRLKSIRDGVQGDVVRFQSGQYPFSETSMDRNDPRNRAKSYMDVTILGNSHQTNSTRGCWEHHRQQQHQLVTALGFVHSFVVKGGGPAAGRRPGAGAAADAPSSNGDDGVHGGVTGNTSLSSLPNNDCTETLAWISLTQTTARDQNVGQGSQLRIYNPVPLALVHPLLLAQDVTTKVHWVVLCTSLCEAYPSSLLPKLPDMHSIWALLDGGTTDDAGEVEAGKGPME